MGQALHIGNWEVVVHVHFGGEGGFWRQQEALTSVQQVEATITMIAAYFFIFIYFVDKPETL